MERVIRVIRWFRALAVTGYVLGTGPLAALGFLLLGIAETGRGRLFALASLSLWSAVLLALLRTRRPLARRWARASWIAAGALLAAAYLLSDRGASRSPAGIESVWLDGARGFNRSDLSNLLPEVDQLQLGGYAFSWVDRLFDRRQAERLRASIVELHRESAASGGFTGLGSRLGAAYDEMLGMSFEQSHAYVYVPAGGPARKPVILFLHGSLGNFQSYTWVWKTLADRLGVAVVAPTFGAGNWQRPSAPAAIDRALAYVASRADLDSGRIYLAGLSNGGRGVTRQAGRLASRLRGLILISPVIETEITDRAEFAQAWAGRPILLVSGESDPRIPPEYVRTAAERLRRNGARVDLKLHPGEDHSLFFARRSEVLAEIESWLSREPEGEGLSRPSAAR